jgi:hypothetical protein
VPGALGGDPKAGPRGVADRLGHVVGVRDPHERCGPLVVEEVEGLSRGVPGLVRLGEDAAVDAGLELGESSCMRNQHVTSIGCGAAARILCDPDPVPDI